MSVFLETKGTSFDQRTTQAAISDNVIQSVSRL